MPEHDDLTPGEVAALTQKKRADQQAAVLAKMGVPFRFGGGIVSVRRAVAQELPQWLAKMNTARPRVALEPSGLPKGLRDWQAERREVSARVASDRQAAAAEWKAGAPARAVAAARAVGAKRRAAMRNQVPPLADHDAIKAVYQEAAALTLKTGVQHHVDHDIPLRGRRVSGLHVASNLVVLRWEYNLRKGNKFTPC